MKKRSASETFELFFTARFPFFFLSGALVLAVAGNMACNLLMAYYVDPFPNTKLVRMLALCGGSIAALIVFVVAIYSMGAVVAMARRRRLPSKTGELTAFKKKRRGVILTLTPNSLASDSVARMVLEKLRPEYVGFLGTQQTEDREIASTLKKEFQFSDDHYKSKHFVPTDISAGVTKTGDVIDWMIKEEGLSRSEVVVDITAGTATMSVSAFIAAEERQIDCQYIYSEYDRDKHQVIPGTQLPILIKEYSDLNTKVSLTVTPEPLESITRSTSSATLPQAVVQTGPTHTVEEVQESTQKHK